MSPQRRPRWLDTEPRYDLEPLPQIDSGRSLVVAGGALTATILAGVGLALWWSKGHRAPGPATPEGSIP